MPVSGLPTIRPVESNPTATLTMELTGPPRKADRGVLGLAEAQEQRGRARVIFRDGIQILVERRF